MTRKQAAYQAGRKSEAEYHRKMHDKQSPGNNRERQDSAHYSAKMAYANYMWHWACNTYCTKCNKPYAVHGDNDVCQVR